MTKTFDVIVLGAGPGGYVAAIRAAQLGKKVAIVEANHLGGICLNWGCIPTKALLKASEVYQTIQHAKDFGISVGKVDIDFKKVIQRSRDVSKQLSQGIAHLMKKNKIEVFDGFGSLTGRMGVQHQIKVEKDGKEIAALSASKVIIATGARARSLPGLEPDEKVLWTYKKAMTPESLPKDLLVIGSGAIGIEFASFYAALGVNVTIAEVQDRILPVEDKEVSLFVQKAFEKRGIKILTATTIKECKLSKSGLSATFVDSKGKSKTQKFERGILAVGIVPNTENIGLEKTNVKLEKGVIQTNKYCETHESGVYAIGDVTAAPWLAHKASHEGVLAAEHLSGHKDVHTLDKNNIPGCTYSMPQVASVGLTEDAAKDAGHTIKVGNFPLIGNGKAIALGEADGFVKTIFDEKTGELLGAHMVGPEVTEQIQGFVIAKTLESTEQELMQTIFPHPTLSEAMHESVLDAFDRAIHF